MSTTVLLPVQLDLMVTRGTDNTIEVTLANPATHVGYDITLDTVRMTIRTGFTGPQLAQLTNLPGAHTAPTSGVTRFKLSRTIIADVANADTTTDFQYEIRRLLASSDEAVFFAGRVRLHPTPA